MSESTALALRVLPEGSLPLLPLRVGEAFGRIRTSLNMGVEMDKMMAFRAIQFQDKAGLELIGKPLDVVNWLCHDIQLLDRAKGELVDCVRTVLILKDGTKVGYVSDGICKSLRAYSAFFGPAPWDPPRTLIVRSLPSKGGRHFYTLDVV